MQLRIATQHRKEKSDFLTQFPQPPVAQTCNTLRILILAPRQGASAIGTIPLAVEVFYGTAEVY